MIKISRSGFVFCWLVGIFSTLKYSDYVESKTYWSVLQTKLIKGNFFVENWEKTEICYKLLRSFPDQEFSLIVADLYNFKVLNKEKYGQPKISFLFFPVFIGINLLLLGFSFAVQVCRVNYLSFVSKPAESSLVNSRVLIENKIEVWFNKTPGV